MRRHVLLLVMLVALLWQSAATVRAVLPTHVLADPEHAALHLHGHAHQHHEDGSVHLENSSEALQHVLSDHSGGTAAPPVRAPDSLLSQASATPAGWHQALAAPPYLEGPLRPPRRRA
jgi:hypothetical protein